MSKKALLVVSFGTSYDSTREKTIDKLEEELSAAFSECTLYRAWTSKMIIKKILKRDGIKINTVTEAMERMLADGIEDVLIQPTHILSGVENDLMTEEALAFEDRFAKSSFGEPLLMYTDDFLATVKAVAEEFKELPANEALVFMGHGTTHQANSVYAALDYIFKAEGYKNIFIGTVEGYPDFDTMLKMLKETEYKKVTLAPFMVVAGDHATNDMAGEDEDSWKSQLEDSGYDVHCVLKGLGEYSGIRQIFIDHAVKAID
ncbi:MAG: sirohydrochlorin cobaltochelatase [Bacillota bacterium]|nr:sirohydrochlorin cobaltochelatase [Bacillota bacterium]